MPVAVVVGTDPAITYSATAPLPPALRFGGGLVGYFGYESVRYIEPTALRRPKPDALGTPDVLQIDGLGGSRLVTSKIAIIKRSERADADVDYTFAQVDVERDLIGYDANNGKLIPELADSWAVEDGGKALRFKLKKGIQFHDGAGEMTSVDVQSTLEQTIIPSSTQYNVAFFRSVLDGFDVSNPYEAVVKLKEPNAEFLNAISAQGWGGEIASKAGLEKLGHTPTMQDRPIPGTGPYTYDGRQQGQWLRFKRVDYKHYRVTPDFPEFEFRIINEASTRMASLLTGEAHMASLPVDLQKQAETSKMKVVAGRSEGLRVFMAIRCCFILDPADHAKGMRYPDSPLANVKVRQAMNKAVDRAAMNKAFFGGKGETTYGVNFLPETHPSFNPAWKANFEKDYGYDVNAAKALLADGVVEVNGEVDTRRGRTLRDGDVVVRGTFEAATGG